MICNKEIIMAAVMPIILLIALGLSLFLILNALDHMKKSLRNTNRNIVNTQTVSAEITYIAPRGTTLLSISADTAEPDETLDVFFELSSGSDINLYDSTGNRYEYWFPCVISKEPKHTYRIATSSDSKDLLTLTIIGRNRVIRRYLEIDFSKE